MRMKDQTKLLNFGIEYKRAMPTSEVMPIHNSTAYEINSISEYDDAVEGRSYYYQRSSNPNRDGLSEGISLLENGEDTLITSSGMAAISTCLLSLLETGDHIIFSKSIYGETIELSSMILEKFGIEVDYVDFTDVSRIENAIKENTKLLYFEIITNPLIEIIDLSEVVKVAKKKNISTIVDSTFTTPFLINPLDYGVDIVIHSLTKFINGHSDVTGGSITSSKEIIDKISPKYLLFGSVMDGFSSYQVVRGLRTFGLRMEKHNSNARAFVELIKDHPAIKYINYPTAAGYRQKELAEKLFDGNYGPMVSIRVTDDLKLVDKFVKELKIVRYLGTLGGYRTSFAHPATAFRTEFTSDELVEMGLHEGLLRFSIGLEDMEDIAKDVMSALNVFL